LCIEYFAFHNQERTKREIEAVGIFYKAGFWHLIAFCHLRGDYRDFRVDRIISIEPTGKIFNSKHPTLKAYIDQMAKEQELDMVVIRVNKTIHSYLESQKYYSGFVSEKTVGNHVEMTFLTASMEGFARWFMMYGDQAEIISPESLKERVGNIALAITQKNMQLSDSY